GGLSTCARLFASRADRGGKLVWPLGHELYLRNLVGAVCAERCWRRPHFARISSGGGVARQDPKFRWRLGRRRHQLPARIPRARERAEHGLANGLGSARPDGGRGERATPRPSPDPPTPTPAGPPR